MHAEIIEPDHYQKDSDIVQKNWKFVIMKITILAGLRIRNHHRTNSNYNLISR